MTETDRYFLTLKRNPTGMVVQEGEPPSEELVLSMIPFLPGPAATEISSDNVLVPEQGNLTDLLAGMNATLANTVSYLPQSFGPDEQAQARANLGIEEGGGTIQSVNGQTGPIVELGPSDVGADGSGTAAGLMAGHVADTDPHPDAHYLKDNSTGTGAVSAGDGSTAAGAKASGFGDASVASGDRSIASGYYSQATNYGSIAIGSYSNCTGVLGIGIGDSVNSSGNRSIAIGAFSAASAANAIAVGRNATASNVSSSAFGAYSTTSREQEHSFGAPGLERFCANLLPGELPSDAVVLSQLETAIEDLTGAADPFGQYVLESTIGAALGVVPLGADSKIDSAYFPASVVGQVEYQGAWDANAGTPPSVSPEKGHYWIVSVAGVTNLSGITEWAVGDWAIYSGSDWQKIDNTDAVSMVAGLVGVITSGDLKTALSLDQVSNVSAVNLRDRSTHTGTQSADTLTESATNKVFTSTERAKLSGIASGATANSTDAQLRDRSTHNGTQLANTISDFSANANTWGQTQTFTVPPVFSDQAGSRTALALGTAAVLNTGTSGATIPLLNAANTWGATQTFTMAPVFTDAAGTRSALALGSAALLASDTDTALAANSDARFATQKAVKTYVDGLLAASDAVVYKGGIDCSANPNYPASDAGHLYVVSVSGKIGGASGVSVEAGDYFICKVDSTASGNQATVGANWNVIQTNIVGAVSGPATAVDGRIATYDGTTGKLIKDSGILISGSDISANASTATALATPRAIYGNNFDGSAALTQIIGSAFGGTGNGFTKFTGPTTSEKTFTLPNASDTIGCYGVANTWTNQNTFAAGTITTSQPFTITQTWNAGAVVFNGLFFNATITAASNSSTLFDFRVNNTTTISCDRFGTIAASAVNLGTWVAIGSTTTQMRAQQGISFASGAIATGTTGSCINYGGVVNSVMFSQLGVSTAAAGAVTSRLEVNKSVTAIANATLTTVVTASIPNAAHSAQIYLEVCGSLGAGGAIGANEATATNCYTITLTRTAGVNVVAAISSAGGASAANVAGAATVTCVASLAAVTGAVGAVNTVPIQVTITRSGGSSTNHTCLVYAKLMNANATGITLS